MDESINFTCIATGTNVSLQWYHNGQPVNLDTNTLYLTNLKLNETGVYQCLWQGITEDDFNSTSWALNVQQPSELVNKIIRQYLFIHPSTICVHLSIYLSIHSFIHLLQIYNLL